MQLNNRPSGVSKDDQRDLPACKRLLVADVLIGAEKNLISGFFRLLN
jgi:hypothetical protein